MKKPIRIIFTALVAIALFFIIGFSAAEAITDDDNFFAEQYIKNNVSQATGLDDKALSEVTDAIQEYLKGKRADLVVTASINGETREIFTYDEKDHMEDVRSLYLGLNLARSLFLIMLAIIVYLDIKMHASISKMFVSACIWLFGFMALFGVGVVFFFDWTFTLFHLIFFKGGWLFDPRVSILINLVPEGFFIACAVRLAAYILGTLTLVFIVSLLFSKTKKKENKEIVG